jgi:bacterioferritin
MKGHDDVVELLNEVLTGELTSINQYFLDAQMLANWGYERLAAHFREQSVGEMRDAEELIERILYLEGMPNLQRLGTLRVGETPVEKLEAALALEREAIERLRRGIDLCGERGDHGSRDLLEDILEGEEDHAAWLETQLSLVRALGAEAYLAQQIRS